MQEEYKGFIDLNNLFKEEHNYDGTSELFDQNFVEAELNGKREKFWFNYNNSKYLFKKTDDKSDDIYAEIIAEEVAKTLGIACASYKLATYNGEKGIITKDFVQENERLMLGVEIMSNVLNKYALEDDKFKEAYGIKELGIKDIHNKLNNLEDVWSILDLFFNDFDNKEELVKMIMNELVKIFMFDLILMQGDRHIRNWGIIINEKDNYIKFAPVFDNSNICGLNRKNVKQTFEGNLRCIAKNKNNEAKRNKAIEQANQSLYHPKLLFSVSEDDIIDITSKKRKTNLDILDYFIEVSAEEYTGLLENYLDIIDEVGIENIIVAKENEIGCNIPEDVKKHVVSTMTLNSMYIRERLEMTKEKRR